MKENDLLEDCQRHLLSSSDSEDDQRPDIGDLFIDALESEFQIPLYVWMG